MSGHSVEAETVEDCIFHGSNALSLDTPIYKYLSLESFMSLLGYENLMFSKITTWPDAFEGSRFDFFRSIKSDDQFSSKTKECFFGSSWTLQTDDSCLYENKQAHEIAEKELQHAGSASMWSTYCGNGGVRIKTTIGKVEAVLKDQVQASRYKFYKGVVVYEPLKYFVNTLKAPNLISKLLIKRVSFRYETEFRFICVSEIEENNNQIFFNLENLFDFVDEFLISPATKNDEWKARMIYHYAVNTSLFPNSSNRKNDKQYCRISNLFGSISEEI